MKRNALRIAAAIALWWGATTACAAGFTFAALGDAPYFEHEEQAFLDVIAEMNAEPLAFAVHVGDLKSGYSACSDALYEQRRDWFDRSRHPFVFVPGDNEWADCWRRLAGHYDPRERMRKLREVFFADRATLGMHRLALTRQSDLDAQHAYPEHARWIHEGVVFATLNVPGSDNNFAHDRAEYMERDAAVRAWISAAFRAARERKLGAVVLFMQANPWSVTGPRRAAFAPLFETLIRETLDFSGEVVLIHGDTHRFRVDQPLLHPETRRRIRNFTRIEVFGSPSVNWVRVRVEDVEGRITFAATPGNEVSGWMSSPQSMRSTDSISFARANPSPP